MSGKNDPPPDDLPPNAHTPEQKTGTRRLSRLLRRGPPLLLIAIGIFLFFFVEAERSLTGRPTMDMLLMLAVANLVFYVWVRVASGFSTSGQFRLVAAVAALQAVLFATVQMEGIYGNGRPVFAWRWAALPADRFRATEKTDPVETLRLPARSHWPQFRGPRRDGISDFRMASWQSLPPRQLWKKPVGAGWSSFCVAGDYCFTMEQRGEEECLVCYEVRTGRQRWVHANPERFSEISGGEGPRTTPAFDNGFLYTLGATGILDCVDAGDGQPVWSVDILKRHEAENCYYGMCGSPLVTGSKVIVCVGGEQASLVACDKRNGNLVWAAGSAGASYSSPQLMNLAGVDQVLAFNAEGLDAHDLQTGEVLWSVPWISNEAERNNVCQPIQVGPDRVFISSGYGRGAALFEVSQRDSRLAVNSVWKNRNLRSKFASAVFDGEWIYGLDEGILVCLDARTGQRRWKNGRYAHGQLVLAGEFLVVQAEAGYVAQVVASPQQFSEVARVRALDRRTWTHPVLADGLLLTRNDRHAVCYQIEPAPPVADQGSAERE